MEITKSSEDEIFQQNAKKCLHCGRNFLLPYEYEYTCIPCGYDVNKRKIEVTKIQRSKKVFLTD